MKVDSTFSWQPIIVAINLSHASVGLGDRGVVCPDLLRHITTGDVLGPGEYQKSGSQAWKADWRHLLVSGGLEFRGPEGNCGLQASASGPADIWQVQLSAWDSLCPMASPSVPAPAWDTVFEPGSPGRGQWQHSNSIWLRKCVSSAYELWIIPRTVIMRQLTKYSGAKFCASPWKCLPDPWYRRYTAQWAVSPFYKEGHEVQKSYTTGAKSYNIECPKKDFKPVGLTSKLLTTTGDFYGVNRQCTEEFFCLLHCKNNGCF